MIRAQDLDELLDSSRQDVLSVALDTDPRRPEHQVVKPAYRIYFRNATRRLLRTVPRRQREAVRENLLRILARLEDPPQGRGLAIFAAPGLWSEFVLPVPLPNRIRYGRPDLISVLWAADEYEPVAILAVDQRRVRVLRMYLGGTTLVDADEFVLDTSDWKFKSGAMRPAGRKSGMNVSRGRQADPFDARVAAQIERFWRGAAEAVVEFLKGQRIDRVVLAGTDDSVYAFKTLLPETLQPAIVGTVHLSPPMTLVEIRRRVLPVALAAEHQRETALVADLVQQAAGRNLAVVGRTATLGALVRGQARLVVADRGAPGEVWWCNACAYASVHAERCTHCGGPVERVELAHVLPLMARRHGAGLELISSGAAVLLSRHEGIGATLRYAISAPAAEG
ncbi:MAG: hypothetical protein HYU65_06530 [Armatimonadetes bacterium]|nr:hypothetical protein [Armatimonadota bacterium]